MFVTAGCVDPELSDPYIDVDEQRTSTDPSTAATVSYRFVHGGFSGTAARFSLYFPTAEEYQGRFFHGTYPTVSEEDASIESIVFGIANGAYVVSTNNGGGVTASPVLGGYRVNAAAAKFSRLVAAVLYGEEAPVRGYLYGASGGAYQTLGGIENTSGVWDGAVPMVPGTPNSIPSFQAVMLLGLRVLGDHLPAIVEALDPGGSGDPYAGLDDEQRAVLQEVTTLGFPPRGWWQHATLAGGAFWTVAGAVKAMDPTYMDEFWVTPGYEGADTAASVRAARVQFDTTVTQVDDTSVTLADAPAGDLTGVDLIFTSGTVAGRSIPFVTVTGTQVTFGPADTAATSAAAPDGQPEPFATVTPTASGPMLGVTRAIAVGDQVRIDNSWFLALQYYQRHQVPTPDLYGWNQFRDPSGAPTYPQRPFLVGPVLAAGSGGIATGRFEGKMIMLASVMDVEAFPWAADWYHQQVRAAVGDDAIDDHLRLWYMDNADHGVPNVIDAQAHVVSYDGELQQALLDLDAWVADGTSPPASTGYSITEDNQIELVAGAQQRGGVQPVVTLAVSSSCKDSSGEVQVDAVAADPVAFTVTAEVPPGAGEIVRVEWDFEGTADYPQRSELDQPSPQVEICETHAFSHPGVYFAVVRVTAHRGGDPEATHGLIQNLARVRVDVT